MQRSRSTVRRGWVAGFITVLALAVSCGEAAPTADDTADQPATQRTTSPSDSQPTSPPSETEAVAANSVTVEATEYAYVMPEQITGGAVTLELINSGQQPHEFAFVRLDDGKTAEDLKAAFLDRKPTKWAHDLAGVGVLSAGLSTSVARELEEGTYAFFCFLPTPEGAPHLVEGMIQDFEVAGTSDAPLPEPDAVVTVTEDGFDVPELVAGRHTIELRNGGSKKHELALVSFEPGKGEKHVGRWFESGYEGQPPALFPGGIQAIKPGQSVIMGIEFLAGRTYTFEDFPNNLRAEVVIP